MLRRKLLAILGSLVLLLLGVAIVAVFMLQGLLADLRHVRDEALTTVEDVSRLGAKVAIIQIDLYRLQLGQEHHLDSLLETAEEIHRMVDEISERDSLQGGVSERHLLELRGQLPMFYRQVGALATSQDPQLAWQYNQGALAATVAMNESILEISSLVGEHAEEEQTQLIERFRWIVLALAIAFLVLINASILIVLRTAEMVLRPVDRLVAASRALGEERFETRVELANADEFGELAKAYNSLAERLQASEQRKLETLRQVALTLNHELNNAMAIIELQLDLLKRTVKAADGQDRYLRQIGESLKRMAQTVESLKRVRRIVLTEYVDGVQMLDLERSVAEEPGEGATGEESPSEKQPGEKQPGEKAPGI